MIAAWKYALTRSSSGTARPTGVLAISLSQDVLRLTLIPITSTPHGKTVNRVVIGCLSMTPAGFVDLYNQMTAVVQRLKKAGKVHRVETPPQQPS
jgi:hypothetical protein